MNVQTELPDLVSLFSRQGELLRCARTISEGSIPAPYRELLAHQSHMTVMVEQFHQSPVSVQILESHFKAGTYCREILLRRTDNGQPVQLGLVRFDLTRVSEEVGNDILDGRIPLGKVLIQHSVPRTIHVDALLEVTAGPVLAKQLQMLPGSITYGRMATIDCHGHPAVELLEILPAGLPS